MELTIVKKAYEVKDPTVDRDYYTADGGWETVFAKSYGQAKMKCNDKNRFIDVKARRAKGSDIVLYDGYETTRWSVLESIKENKRREKRLLDVMRFPETEMFYVQKGYVGNSCYWWALGNRGYTTDLNKAEKYDREDILKHFIGRSEENKIWAASHVETKVSRQVDSQHLDYEFMS